MSAYRLSDLSIYLDSSQDLLVAGNFYDYDSSADYLFVRSYDLDPSSDNFGQTNTGFGTSGYTLIQTTSGYYLYADYLSVDASGKILLAGSHGAPETGDSEQLVVRLNANGSLDTTFGTSGIASVDIASGNDNAQFVQTLSNGNIVVIGSSYFGSGSVTGSDIGVTLLSASGAEISTSLINIGTFDYFQNARVLSDNSVLLQSTYDSTTTITKLVATGDPLTYGIDATFGASGILAVQQGSSFETLPDGSFLVFQTTSDEGDGRDLRVTKYLADGTPDTSFGSGGSTTLELPETDLNFVNLGVDQDGNITILAEDSLYSYDSYFDVYYKEGDLGNVVFELSSTGSLIDTVYIDNFLDESSSNSIWTIPGDLTAIQVVEVPPYQFADSFYAPIQVASITPSIEPLDLFWTPPSTVSGVTTEGSWDFTTLGAHDFLSLVGENFTSYGLDWSTGYYGVGHSLGSQEVILPDSVTKFLVDQDGFVFEGRQSASEVVVLVGDVSDTTLLFNESNHDMDYLAFVATQGVTQVNSADVIVASGVSLDMSNTDSNNEFQVTRTVDSVQIATVSDVEAVSGTSVGDTLKGNDYQNVLFGRGGDDLIVGGANALAESTVETPEYLSLFGNSLLLGSETSSIELIGGTLLTSDGAYFDGVDNKLVVHDIEPIGTKDFVLSFDFKSEGTQDLYSVLVSAVDAFGVSNGPSGWSGSSFYATLQEGNFYKTVLTDASFNDEQWHEASLLRVGDELTLIIDDQEIDSISGVDDLDLSFESFTIGDTEGVYASNTDNNFKGWVKDFSLVVETNTLEDRLEGIALDGTMLSVDTNVSVISSADIPAGNDARTYSAWIRFDGENSAGGVIVNHGIYSANQHAVVFVRNGAGSGSPGTDIAFDTQGGWVSSEDISNYDLGNSNVLDLGDNEWHHVVVSFDPTSSEGSNTGVTFFVDGHQIGTVIGANGFNKASVDTTATDLTIGYETLTDYEHVFDGRIDEVGVFDRAYTGISKFGDFLASGDLKDAGTAPVIFENFENTQSVSEFLNVSLSTSILESYWDSTTGTFKVTLDGSDASIDLDNPLYYATLEADFTNISTAMAVDTPMAWSLVSTKVEGGNLLLEFIDLNGNAANALATGVSKDWVGIDLAFDQSGGQLSGGTEWLVGGKGADTITSGASQDTVLVDLDEATMVGGVGKDTFVVRGEVSEDGSTHLDTVLGDGATVKGFQVSDYTTSLGGNLGNARDVITFNVSLGWLAAAGLTLDSLNAWDRLYDGQDQLLGAERTLLQQALLHELSVEFVPDATSASQSVVQLVDDAGNIGAFATLSGWILPKELDANSTFSAVLINTELAPPIQNGGVPILVDMRVNDATAVDVEVLGRIEDALTNFAYTVVTDTEFDTLVLDAWEEVTGQTVTLDQLAVLSPVVNQTITLYDGQVNTLGSSLDSETRAYDVDGTTAITPYDVVGVDETDLSALISQIDTSHIFEDTVNLSFAIVGERANTVHGLQDTPGTLRSNVDNDSTSGSYGQDVATIFTPGRADEVIASGKAADTFEYLRQDLDEAPPASAGDPDPSKGNFGHDVIVDFAGSASADNNVNDLLLIQGVQLDVVDVVEDVLDGDGNNVTTVVSQALDDLFVSKDDFDAEVADPTAGASSAIYASRTTLGDNAVDSSLRVQWTGDGTNPGGDVTLYRQYDPTTDRFRVEKVQLGEDEYSLGDTNAVRDVDGNIIGSIYTTDAEKSILVGSDNVQETFTSTSSGNTGTMIIGGFQGSEDLDSDPSTTDDIVVHDQIDLSGTVFDTLVSAKDNGDGTYYIKVSDGSPGGVMEIFLEGTFNEDDLLLAGT